MILYCIMDGSGDGSIAKVGSLGALELEQKRRLMFVLFCLSGSTGFSLPRRTSVLRNKLDT
jgi:hypothetical protein